MPVLDRIVAKEEVYRERTKIRLLTSDLNGEPCRNVAKIEVH